MSKKDAYEDKLRAQMELWNAEIARLKAKADMATAEAQIRNEKLLDDLAARQKEAQAQFRALQDAGEGAWADVMDGMEKAWQSLEASLKTAQSRFK
jgi:hypothetical protein